MNVPFMSRRTAGNRWRMSAASSLTDRFLCDRCGVHDVRRTPQGALVWRRCQSPTSRQKPQRLACVEAGLPGASQLIVRTIADEQGMCWEQVQPSPWAYGAILRQDHESMVQPKDPARQPGPTYRLVCSRSMTT